MRLGRIRTPHYRVVVVDARTKRDGRAIEEIGQYHPKSEPSSMAVNSQRVQYWLSVGAQPTEAVIALLKRTGDWQQFTGDTSPAGIDPQPAKKDKLAAFNAALAEKGGEPVSAAVTQPGSDDSGQSTSDRATSGRATSGQSTSDRPTSTVQTPTSDDANTPFDAGQVASGTAGA
jgi:small subunit ribosomal protein S16